MGQSFEHPVQAVQQQHVPAAALSSSQAGSTTRVAQRADARLRRASASLREPPARGPASRCVQRRLSAGEYLRQGLCGRSHAGRA